MIPETVILSPEEAGTVTGKPPTAPQPGDLQPKTTEPPLPDFPQPREGVPPELQPREEEDIIPETVILSPEETGKGISAPDSDQRPRDLDSQSREPRAPEVPAAGGDLPRPRDEEDVIPETVILSPGDVSRQPPAPPADLSADEVAAEEEKARTRKKKMEDTSEDDFVVQTVFLSPDKPREQDPDDDNE